MIFINLIIDKDAINILLKYKWSQDKFGYWTSKINGKNIKMHRLIFEIKNGNIPDGYFIDHINRRPYDNRISNLRLATPKQNNLNREIKSKYKGVSFCKKENNFRARISYNGKEHFLGKYNNPIDAAIAYDIACVKYFDNEFININFPENINKYKTMVPYKFNKYSKFYGIYFEKDRNKFSANVIINNKVKRIKRFDTEIEAIIFRNKYIIENNLTNSNKLNEEVISHGY